MDNNIVESISIKTTVFVFLAIAGFFLVIPGVAGIAFFAPLEYNVTPFSVITVVGFGFIFWSLLFSITDMLIDR